MNGIYIRVLASVLILSHAGVVAWDNIDFELFDLVEEVKTNFYEILGVSQGATPAEIRRAYRKLSLQLHPDRSDDPSAEEKFRNLVAVSEVLKDEEKRKRYDIILRDGLPDWRQPVFYYRRVRKMGFLEFLAFIVGIFTVGHFIVLWSIYLEKKFELDDVLTSARKKKEKRNRKLIKQGANVEDIQVDDILNEEGIHKPTFWDLLPFALYRLTVSTIRDFQQRREYYQQEKLRLKLLQEEEERERAKEAENPAKPRRRRVVQQPGLSADDYATWQGAPVNAQGRGNEDESGHKTQSANGITEEKKEGEWDEEDQSKLSRLMVKYPGGTPGRWEKVACEMGRSVKDITKQVKQTKLMYKDQTVPHSGEGAKLVVGRKMATLNDNITTQAVGDERNGLETKSNGVDSSNGNITNQPTRNRSEMCDKGYSTTSVSSTTKEDQQDDKQDDKGVWSQNQQKMFEKALASVGKDAPDRWTQIARCVPAKTKEWKGHSSKNALNQEECIARYKFLVEVLKKRKRGDTDKVG